jgi:hypothetical protein
MMTIKYGLQLFFFELTDNDGQNFLAGIVQSRAINFGHQGHSLTQSKMLHCKTVVNIVTYHHVVCMTLIVIFF